MKLFKLPNESLLNINNLVKIYLAGERHYCYSHWHARQFGNIIIDEGVGPIGIRGITASGTEVCLYTAESEDETYIVYKELMDKLIHHID